MSRILAGFGAVVGAGVGGLAGGELAVRVRDKAHRSEVEAAEAGTLMGAILGAFSGAAIGAGGGCTVKHVGTAGVGHLPSGMGGGLFP